MEQNKKISKNAKKNFGFIMKIFISLFCFFSVSFMLYSDFADPTAWLSFVKKNASSSSVLVEKGKPASYYDASKAFDGNGQTSWCEGKEDYGIGETLEIKFKPIFIDRILIFNGYGGNASLYRQNSRVKKYSLEITLKDNTVLSEQGTMEDNQCGQDPFEIEKCNGSYGPLDYKLAAECKRKRASECSAGVFHYGRYRTAYAGHIVDLRKLIKKPAACVKGLKIKILDVYKGEKFKDTCIAEVQSYNTEGDLNDEKIMKEKLEELAKNGEQKEELKELIDGFNNCK